MTIDATAEALAGDTLTPAEPSILEAPSAPEPEGDLGAELDAIWEKNQSSEEPVDPAPEAEVDPAAEPEPAAAEPAPEAPSYLPHEIKSEWAGFSEGQRDLISKQWQDLNARHSEATRTAQGLKPIQEELVGAIRDIPALAQKRPEEVAASIRPLIMWGEAGKTDPRGTLSKIAQAWGVSDMLNGQAAQQPQAQQTEAGSAEAALRQQIALLGQKLEQATNPDFIANQVSAITAQERLQAEVDSFASSKDHWGDVEADIPHFVPVARARLGEGASATEVLNSAYDLAVKALVSSPKAPQPAAAEAAPLVDPAKAREAKSLNVSGSPANGRRAKTEDEALADVWNKNHA